MTISANIQWTTILCMTHEILKGIFQEWELDAVWRHNSAVWIPTAALRR